LVATLRKANMAVLFSFLVVVILETTIRNVGADCIEITQSPKFSSSVFVDVHKPGNTFTFQHKILVQFGNHVDEDSLPKVALLKPDQQDKSIEISPGRGLDFESSDTGALVWIELNMEDYLDYTISLKLDVGYRNSVMLKFSNVQDCSQSPAHYREYAFIYSFTQMTHHGPHLWVNDGDLTPMDPSCDCLSTLPTQLNGQLVETSSEPNVGNYLIRTSVGVKYEISNATILTTHSDPVEIARGEIEQDGTSVPNQIFVKLRRPAENLAVYVLAFRIISSDALPIDASAVIFTYQPKRNEIDLVTIEIVVFIVIGVAISCVIAGLFILMRKRFGQDRRLQSQQLIEDLPESTTNLEMMNRMSSGNIMFDDSFANSSSDPIKLSQVGVEDKRSYSRENSARQGVDGI